MLVRQTRRSVSCSSALLLLLSSVGFSGQDPWLKYTTEAAQLRRDGLNSEAEARYVSAYRAVADTAESGRLGRSLIDLANLYTDMGRYADAEIAAQRALKVYQKISDPKSHRRGHCSKQLGRNLPDSGKVRSGRAAVCPGA